jgi:hypothetical protein
VCPDNGVEPQHEDLGHDRGVAEPADRGRAPLRLPGRHRPEADLGGRGEECLAAGSAGVNVEGYREILGIVEGAKEDKAS